MTDADALSIIQKFKDINGNLISRRVNPHTLQVSYPELYDFLINRYADTNQISEIIYRLENHIESAPVCPICGNPLKFIRYCKGYQQYCSNKCKYSEQAQHVISEKSYQTQLIRYNKWYTQTDEYIEKSQQTSLQKYNTLHPSQSLTVQQHSQQTCMKKFSVPFSFQSENNISKREQTMMSKYGTSIPMQIPSVKNKYHETCVINYGDYYVKTAEFHAKSLISRRQTEKEKWQAEGYDIDFLDNQQVIVHNCCPTHGDIVMSVSTFFNRKNQHTCMCTICNPLVKGSSSYQEILIEKYLKENNIDYQMHNRTILGNHQELDFYIPDYQLAIECNGLYWHSDIVKTDKHYHQNKSIICESLGLILIHIWEDTMYNNPESVYHLLDKHLQLHNKLVSLSDCTIIEINELNKLSLTVIYDDIPIACMIFGISPDFCYSMNMYQEIDGYLLINGMHDLLKYFIDNYKYHSLMVQIDYNVSNSLVIKDLDFQQLTISHPTPYYVNNHEMQRLSLITADNYYICYDAGFGIYKKDNIFI